MRRDRILEGRPGRAKARWGSCGCGNSSFFEQVLFCDHLEAKFFLFVALEALHASHFALRTRFVPSALPRSLACTTHSRNPCPPSPRTSGCDPPGKQAAAPFHPRRFGFPRAVGTKKTTTTTSLLPLRTTRTLAPLPSAALPATPSPGSRHDEVV